MREIGNMKYAYKFILFMSDFKTTYFHRNVVELNLFGFCRKIQMLLRKYFIFYEGLKHKLNKQL